MLLCPLIDMIGKNKNKTNAIIGIFNCPVNFTQLQMVCPTQEVDALSLASLNVFLGFFQYLPFSSSSFHLILLLILFRADMSFHSQRTYIFCKNKMRER